MCDSTMFSGGALTPHSQNAQVRGRAASLTFECERDDPFSFALKEFAATSGRRECVFQFRKKKTSLARSKSESSRTHAQFLTYVAQILQGKSGDLK